MKSVVTVLYYTVYCFQAEKSKVAVFKISSICLHIPQVREIFIFFSLTESLYRHTLGFKLTPCWLLARI